MTLNGEAFPAGNYTYNETTGEFATLPGTITVPPATYSQNEDNGFYVINPGVTTLVISGTV